MTRPTTLLRPLVGELSARDDPPLVLRRERPASTLLDALAPTTGIGIGVGVPLVLVATFEIDASRLPLLLVTAIAGWRLSWTTFRSSGGIVQPFFYLYFFLFLGVAPLVQLGVGRLPWSVVPDDGSVRTAAMVVLLALLAHEVGNLVGRGRASRPRPPTPVRRVLDARRVRLLLTLALVLYAIAIARLGGPGALFSSRFERGETLYGTRASEADSLGILLSVATTAVVFVAAYASVLVAKRSRSAGQRVVALLAVLLAVTLTNPVSSARYHVGVVWGGLLIAVLWPLTRRKVAALMIAFTAGLVVVFPLLNLFRTATTRDSDGPSTAVLGTVDFDSFQMAATAVSYVRLAGYQLGEQLLGAVTFWVPRSLWPGKPQGSGSILGESFGFPITNLSTPLPAELYLDGGLVLVVVVLVVYGLLGVRADAHVESRTMSWTGLFVPVFAIYQVILLRGSLLQAMMLISLIAGALWFATARVARPDDAGPRPADRREVP
ncbi:hypothetical protein [Cellulosimicrobium arenosum]|uniref:O-antigen polysaccharide polymerase Wzy n=1 Tax=Cellulosimicrobium arenosum TaxID=2708133 RepID=A0A927J0U0_9MICO|nr:hypothetical protein [Cellulosimicrobium arenosum]MBD8079768.1 hypothetical protein [Cellulosimicrobium arenosum]